MHKRLFLAYCFLLVLFASPCLAEPLPITVSVAPLKYFVDQIGGEQVDVTVMVPAGASPATYEPKSRQMAALTKAKLFIAIGVPFERAWLPRLQAANPDMEVVKALAGVELMRMQTHHHEGHEEDSCCGEQLEGHLDPHVWTSPKAAKVMATTILSSLIQAAPERRDVYRKNFDQLIVKIEKLDSELKQLLSGKQGTRFLVYHPSWGYFARDYKLIQVPVELEGKAPGPRELAQIIRMAEKNGIKVVFAQPQFSKKSAQIVANGIGGKVVLADPMAEDWANNLRKVARSIKEALR